MIVVTELSGGDDGPVGWYVNGIKVYDYHDPYIDELLRSLFGSPEFRDIVKYESDDWEWEEDEKEYELPETIEI
jgi:hypothetical protein